MIQKLKSFSFFLQKSGEKEEIINPIMVQEKLLWGTKVVYII